MPVVRRAGNTSRLGQDPPDRFKNDPVLGTVQNLGLGRDPRRREGLRGVLAATILFIATNAGVIRASRITYSIASTGNSRRSSGGCTSSDAVALARRLRGPRPDHLPARRPGRLPRPDVRVRRNALVHDRPSLRGRAAGATTGRRARVAGAAEHHDRRHQLAHLRDGRRRRHRHGLARRRHPGCAHSLRRSSAGSPRASFLRRLPAAPALPLTATVRAPVPLGPALALEYRSILVPIVAGDESREAVEVAARLATSAGRIVLCA